MNSGLFHINPFRFLSGILDGFRTSHLVTVGAGLALVLLAVWLLIPAKPKSKVARLGGVTWKRNQFCRGWLITGDTGSGKTSSGINQLAHQVFQNEPRWGGLCIDEKGVYWETLSAMARHYGREDDLVHLQIHADPSPSTAQFAHAPAIGTGIAHRMGIGACIDHQLFGNAAADNAGAAHAKFLGHGHACTALGRHTRGAHAARTAADDKQVIIE